MASRSPYAADRIAALAESIVHHKRAYYAGKPEIADAAYDRLEDELRTLAPNHPALSLVGGALTSDLPKVKHAQPMLSLQKTYDVAELLRWADADWVVGTLKIDGVSMSLIYEDGSLTQAKTRGNGLVGEDVTVKVRWVSDVVPQVPLKGTVEIRGELYCSETNFIRLAEEMTALGLDRPTSPRNIVAGLLGRKTHSELARHFNFFGFNLSGIEQDLGLKSEMEQLTWLGNNGFRLPLPERLQGEAAVSRYLEQVREAMNEGEVPADGAVFSYDNLAKQHALGNTAHHPRYKISFKWQGETAVSRISDVTWATSRLGIVTPVAVIEPVSLSGAMITNVTLHNAAHVNTFGIKAGDQIEIVRSGEVIPKFLQIIEAASGAPQLPTHCPSCGAGLLFDDVRLICPNTEGCPAQQLGSILNWIKVAEIDDLSEKRLSALMQADLVRSIPDLYRLQLEDFFKIPQTKDKMASKLHANIDRSRKLPLARFLSGLGIEGAGVTTWEKLIAEAPTLKNLRALTAEQIAAIEGFAAKSAVQLVDGLKAKAALIDELLAVGITVEEGATFSGDGPLSGKQLVITGALSRPRAEIEKAIKAAGGKVGSSVSSATHAVITEDTDSTSSKMVKAKKLGIPIWNEADLQKALAGT
ncbi:MAG: DNA ligase (NAD(+)) LigA [Deltaproteobacteria bacterium]|nr:DNA ligase (NAD(+)) LigA [Deltaproteobacteria bacterium]